MGYPQPNANQYSTGGQGFFRLNTTLTSDGDMYESEQGAHGFAIGPDSDISKVNVAYFDDQISGRQQLVSISPTRPFPGFIDAINNEGLYTPSNRPGRILIWPSEIFNSDFLPSDFDADRLDFEIPVLDVVEYFAPGPATPERNNKSYYMQRFPWPSNGGDWYYVIPFYGRRYANIIFANEDNVRNLAISAFGVKYKLRGATGGNAVEIPVIVSTPVASNVEIQDEILSSTDGMYDAIYFKFTQDGGPGVIPTGDTPFSVTVSDREQ